MNQPNQNRILSPRELQITALIAEERTDDEIACQLGIQAKTVRNINMNSRKKLKVVSRVGMALWYVRNYGFPATAIAETNQA
jgi:DNA-binding CsgD family transcriptional regulator